MHLRTNDLKKTKYIIVPKFKETEAEKTEESFFLMELPIKKRE